MMNDGEKTTPRLSTSTHLGLRMVVASVCLLALGTLSVLSVKFTYMACVPDFSHADTADTCPSPFEIKQIGNATAAHIKKDGCSAVTGCTAWQHPILQIAFVNFTMMLCLPAHLMWKAWNGHHGYSEIRDGRETSRSADSDDSVEAPFVPSIKHLLQLCLIGIGDSGGNCLWYIGLEMMYASTFSMLRLTACILFTAALNRIYLKRQLRSTQAYGLLFVLGK